MARCVLYDSLSELNELLDNVLVIVYHVDISTVRRQEMKMFYTTENPDPLVDMPDYTRNWTCEQIISYGQKHFDFDPINMTSKNQFTAYMRTVSKTIFDPSDWKNPIYVRFPYACGQEWVKACIVWFHGAKPIESFVGVYSRGYAC